MNQQTISLLEIDTTRQPIRDVWRKDTSGAGGNHYLLEPSRIIIREGFNVRKDFGDIEALAASIKENGQLQPGYVDAWENGQFILTDGHRRFAAVQLLVSQGEDVRFKVIVNSGKMTEEQRILQMFITQDNKHLEPIEAAELIRRLSNYGHDGKAIAKKIGRSETYVSNMLSFSTESPVVQQAVSSDRLTVTGALALKRAIPSQQARDKAVKEAAEGNTGKIDVAAVAGQPKRKGLAELVAENERLRAGMGRIEKLLTDALGEHGFHIGSRNLIASAIAESKQHILDAQ